MKWRLQMQRPQAEITRSTHLVKSNSTVLTQKTPQKNLTVCKNAEVSLNNLIFIWKSLKTDQSSEIVSRSTRAGCAAAASLRAVAKHVGQTNETGSRPSTAGVKRGSQGAGFWETALVRAPPARSTANLVCVDLVYRRTCARNSSGKYFDR